MSKHYFDIKFGTFRLLAIDFSTIFHLLLTFSLRFMNIQIMFIS